MRAPKVGDTLHYFAEGNTPEEAFSGPYAALVTFVQTQAQDGTWRVELTVFPPGCGTGKPKTSVLLVDEPAKHCCTWPPSA